MFQIKNESKKKHACRRIPEWVLGNDIYLDGGNGLEGADGEERKICGILTEAVSDVESGTIESVVVGIGLNVSTRDFSPDLARIAGSLFPGSVSRNRLAAGIAERLMDCQERLGDPELIREYRNRSLLLGREVRFTFEFFPTVETASTSPRPQPSRTKTSSLTIPS